MQGLIGASADLLEEDSHPPNVASNSNWYSEAAQRPHHAPRLVSALRRRQRPRDLARSMDTALSLKRSRPAELERALQRRKICAALNRRLYLRLGDLEAGVKRGNLHPEQHQIGGP